jgi:hypothetical protein
MLHKIINPHFTVTNTFTLMNHHPNAVKCSTTFTMTNMLVNATEMDQKMIKIYCLKLHGQIRSTKFQRDFKTCILMQAE